MGKFIKMKIADKYTKNITQNLYSELYSIDGDVCSFEDYEKRLLQHLKDVKKHLEEFKINNPTSFDHKISINISHRTEYEDHYIENDIYIIAKQQMSEKEMKNAIQIETDHLEKQEKYEKAQLEQLLKKYPK